MLRLLSDNWFISTAECQSQSPRIVNLIDALAMTSICLTSTLLGACGSNVTLKLEGRQRTIVVPTHAVVQPDRQGQGEPSPRRYVVRMSDGNLDWEIELPEVATGYELRIPFKGKAAGGAGTIDYQNSAPLTAADKELISALRRQEPSIKRDGIYDANGAAVDDVGRRLAEGDQRGAKESENGRERSKKSTQSPPKRSPRPSRQSYLVGLEKARQLFKARKYELAIIALKSLDEDYPNDVTIKSMLGTLWLQLNQPSLARASWEAALAINPNNRAVIEALKQLQSSVEEIERSAQE